MRRIVHTRGLYLDIHPHAYNFYNGYKENTNKYTKNLTPLFYNFVKTIYTNKKGGKPLSLFLPKNC